MKHLKSDDKVIMSVRLTAWEARQVRDLLFQQLARVERAEDELGMFGDSVGELFFEHLQRCEEKERAPAYKKMYHALRSALRLPVRDVTFNQAYSVGWSLKRKVKLFAAWVDSLREVFDTEDDHAAQEHALCLIERSTRPLGCSQGAVLTQEGWCWAGRLVGTWDDLVKHLVEHYSASDANRFEWEARVYPEANNGLYNVDGAVQPNAKKKA